MAHFAQITEHQVVTQVIVIDNSVLIDPANPEAGEQESRGQDFINNVLGLSGTWLQTSYNGTIRRKYAGIGDVYDPDYDMFFGKDEPHNIEHEGVRWLDLW